MALNISDEERAIDSTLHWHAQASLFDYFRSWGRGRSEQGVLRGRRSPFGIVLLSPELVAGFIHEHAVLEEHNVDEPGEEEDHWDDEEELPVGPGQDCDEDADEEEVKQRALRWCVPHDSSIDSKLLY